MSLFQLKNIQLSYGELALLDCVDFNLTKGERVCLVGRNGCGKSTLLKLIAGEIVADDGQRVVDKSVVVARLEQDPPERNDLLIYDYVAEGLAKTGELLKNYNHLLTLVSQDPSQSNLSKLEKLQGELESADAWQLEQQISQTLSMLQLDGTQSLATLSGGWRRKAALARALVRRPDVLLLDEPTNHLDIKMIEWLENSLQQYSGALVFISHDRAFIRRMATRIVDLDRGKLFSYPGNYATYLEKKAQDLEVEASQDALFDKKLQQEEVWIRQGIKARRTRNEGRVRALKALREERSKRRSVQGSVVAKQSMAQRSGKRVIELSEVSLYRSDLVIAKQLDLQLQRGDRVALIGPNGCGKSSLIQSMLGELEIQQGTVKLGSNIELAYFDQHRQQLNLDESVIDAIGEGKRDLIVNGRPRHVMSYLQDYLFSPDQVNAPVRALSGGEKNRLLLAKIMLKPSNLLILDEPTNDLDVDTLEMLETLLINYEGTLLLVSHDREFVDNVATSCLVYEGEGVWREFIGGFSDAEKWHQENRVVSAPESSTKTLKNPKSERKTTKLSYKQQKELSELPETIDVLETSIASYQAKINTEGFFQQPDSKNILAALEDTEKRLEQAYSRWDELESLKQQIQ